MGSVRLEPASSTWALKLYNCADILYWNSLYFLPEIQQSQAISCFVFAFCGQEVVTLETEDGSRDTRFSHNGESLQSISFKPITIYSKTSVSIYTFFVVVVVVYIESY